jgi:hypothetical protein
MSFIDDIQIILSSFLVEFVDKKGGDVMDVNAIGFILLNVHPWFVLNLYLIFSLVSIHF